MEEKIETHKENVKAFDGEWEKYCSNRGTFRKKMVDHDSAEKNLEPFFDVQESYISYIEASIADVRGKMNLFLTNLYGTGIKIQNTRSEMREQQRKLRALEMRMRHIEGNNQEEINLFLEKMHNDLTTGLSEWERNKEMLENMIAKWKNMVEREREYVAVECLSCIDQIRDRAKFHFAGGGGGAAAGLDLGARTVNAKTEKDNRVSREKVQDIISATEDVIKAFRA